MLLKFLYNWTFSRTQRGRPPQQKVAAQCSEDVVAGFYWWLTFAVESLLSIRRTFAQEGLSSFFATATEDVPTILSDPTDHESTI